MDAYHAYHNVFRCMYCRCIHGWVDPKKYPRVKPIVNTQRYADCTAWWCPKCGRPHDSRQLGDTFLGMGGPKTVTPVNPRNPDEEVVKVKANRDKDNERYEYHFVDRDFPLKMKIRFGDEMLYGG